MNGLSSTKRWPVCTLLVLSISAMLMVSGCGNNTDDDLSTGTFSAEVSGAVSHNFTGISVFAVQQIDPPVGNIFVLSNNTTASGPVFAVNLSMRSDNRPGTGTHQIGADGSVAGASFIRYSEGSESLYFGSVSGQMTVNRSSSDRFEGELNFTARNNEQQEVNVSIRFNARCLQAPSVSCS